MLSFFFNRRFLVENCGVPDYADALGAGLGAQVGGQFLFFFFKFVELNFNQFVVVDYFGNFLNDSVSQAVLADYYERIQIACGGRQNFSL